MSSAGSENVGEYWAAEVDLSQADLIARLSEEEREEILAGIDPASLQYDFNFWGRPSQLSAVNSTHWMTVCLAGRGWGKSRVLSEAINKYAREHPRARMALVGRTASEVREVMVNGDSGVLATAKPDFMPIYKPGIRSLIWPNGAFALCLSAEKSDSFRGQQFHASFCDEIGSYKNATGEGLMSSFDQIKVATRLGETQHIFVATTPRRVPIITDLVKEAIKKPDQIKLIRGSTKANRALSAQYMEVMEGMYGGSRLGRQELDGELLSDVEGALLSQMVIDIYRREDLGVQLESKDPREEPAPLFWPQLPYRLVGVDPSVSANPGDECGIVVVGSTDERKLYQRHGFVIEDASMKGSPTEWAKRAVAMARKYKAAIIAEANQGGELVKTVIQAIDPKVPVTLVHAKVGKMARAEPVGVAYEQGRVHHLGWYEKLEEQLTTWDPTQGYSPDRMDALVWALTGLLVRAPERNFGRITANNMAVSRTLPNVREFDPHRAAESRRPVGKELEDATRRVFGIEPAGPSTTDDLEEANLPRNLPAHMRSLRISNGDPVRGRSSAYRPPSMRFR